MNNWEISLARAREEFVEALARRGFILEGGLLRGAVTVPDAGTRSVEIHLPETFPYRSPKLRPVDGSGELSWHQEPDGCLCLYSEKENSDLPWSDPAAFLERAAEWFVHDLAGWAGDPPDLDLERYIEPAAKGFVIYRNLDTLIGNPIRARRQKNDVIEVIGTGTAPKKHRGKLVFGWADELGELDRPVRDWAGIEAILGKRATRIERELGRGRGELLLLRYRRGPHLGALALRVSTGSPVEIRALGAADASNATLRLRAGKDAALLRKKRVAILGLGAIGSFLADLLARGGIGWLMLQDGDPLRPGNSVRHLVGKDYWGWNKAAAVADIIAGCGWMDNERLTVVDKSLRDPAAAHRLLQDHDLVIDATASGPTTSMLADLAAAAGRPLISVCIQREGDVIRADRWPLRPGERHAPPVPPKTSAADLREAGCGDPVSPAPPVSPAEAAALAWRISADVLCEGFRFPATIVHVSAPDEVPPYNKVGTVA